MHLILEIVHKFVTKRHENRNAVHVLNYKFITFHTSPKDKT